MEKKYGFLRAFSVIMKILAWLILIGSLVTAFVLVVAGGVSPTQMGEFSRFSGVVTGAFMGVIAIIFGILYFLFFYASAELIMLLISIEENTRKSAQLLSKSQ
jgi:hypothetical protein